MNRVFGVSLLRRSLGGLRKPTANRRSSTTATHSEHPHHHKTTVEEAFARDNLPPLIGILVGVVSLYVQIGLILPWHDSLSEQFESLEKNMKTLDRTAATIDRKMDQVVRLESDVDGTNSDIANKENAIFASQMAILAKVDEIWAQRLQSFHRGGASSDAADSADKKVSPAGGMRSIQRRTVQTSVTASTESKEGDSI